MVGKKNNLAERERLVERALKKMIKRDKGALNRLAKY